MAPVAIAPEPSDPVVGTITIAIRTVPPHATLVIDNGPAVSAPRSFTVATDEHPHLVQVKAPRFATTARTISFDRSQSLVIELAPRRK
jgi:hypothetical protein